MGGKERRTLNKVGRRGVPSKAGSIRGASAPLKITLPPLPARERGTKGVRVIKPLTNCKN
jgi:hypothetical protein